MVRKYIHIFTLLIVTSLSYALINSATALADGEKWTLTEKTTIKVTGGALGGTAVTLKPNSGDGRADPSVWTETGSKSAFFTSGTDKICVRVNGLVDIDNNRSKTGSIDLVDPGWCSSPLAPSGPGVRGAPDSTGLSTKATLTSTIVTAPLKCGDAGFMGPCAEPFDPATTDCSTVTDTTARTRCESIQICINIGGGKADECTSGWDACMATYSDADEGAKGAGVAKCADGVKKKDFEVGKYDKPEGEETSSCEVEAVGWIICPVMNFIGMITDASYIAVASLLDTPASMFDTSRTEGQATQSAWGIMRNIANVAFVIAFMVIIYSQLTSVGVSNYGVKKLLPKLIIAAILVNMSFIISALAVDLSNIVGHSTKQLFDSFADSIKVTSPDGGVVELDGSNVWMNLVGGILGGTLIVGVSLYAGLSVLLPMLIGALAAVVTVVIVLTLRQALIVLLVVISPLAFVALLLPNTENWFKKWRSIFFVMLIMFPVVAAIFGISAFAGKIVMLSSDNMFVQIMGAGITIIPLFITPIVMKAAGGVLNRFAGIVNNTDKGMFDRMRKGAEGVRKNQEGRRAIRSLSGGKGVFKGKYQRAARRAAISKGIENEANRSSTGYVAKQAQDVDAFANQIAGGTRLGPDANPQAVQRALAGAINVQAKLEADEVNAAKAVIQNLNLNTTDRATLEQGGTITAGGKRYQGGSMQKAAISNAVSEQRMGDIENIAQSSDLDNEAAKHLAQTIQANYATTKSKSAHLVDANNLHKLSTGSPLTNNDLNTATVEAMNGMSPELMSTQKSQFLDRAHATTQDIQSASPSRTYTNNDAQAANNIRQTANDLYANQELLSKMGQAEQNTVYNIG